MFSDRLDFLMKMTDTSNSALGHAISLDPSYISKIRRGERKPLKQEAVIDSLCEFLARRLIDEKRRDAVADVVLKGFPLPSDPYDVRDVLKVWLTSNGRAEHGFTADIPSDLPSGSFKGSSDIKAEKPSAKTGGKRSGSFADIYYGNEGKRQGACDFLRYVAGKGSGLKGRTLLLFSNEDMKWMYESPGFLQEWAALLVSILKQGMVIRIIHTVTRDLNEMMEAVRNWMPLYLAGTIEPYYCPKLRDDIYRRSLFVAPGICAMTSTSVGTKTEKMANLVFYDKDAVSAFEDEFRAYYALCRPLMKMIKDNEGQMVYTSLRTILKEDKPVIFAGAAPVFLTLPDVVPLNVSSRTYKAISSLREDLYGLLRRRVNVTEVFRLPDISDVKSGAVKGTVWPGSSITYTAASFGEHLREIIRLLKQYDNYEVKLTAVTDENIKMIASDDGDAILMTPYPILFEVCEKNLSAALYEYAGRLPGEKRKDKVIEELEAYLKEL